MNVEALIDGGNLKTHNTDFLVKLQEYSNLIIPAENTIAEDNNRTIVDELKVFIDKQLKKIDYDIDYDKQELPDDDFVNLNEIKASLDTFDTNCNLNMYRQSFILYVALFEASFVDMLQIIIKKNFFSFIRKNGKLKESDNVKLKDIIRFDCFDLFQESIINEVLEGNRIRSLITMLYNFNNNYFIVDGNDISNDIYEIIARRNIHLHKSGIVDKGYFKQSQCGKTQYKLGDYLAISCMYFDNSCTVLSNFMNNLLTI